MKTAAIIFAFTMFIMASLPRLHAEAPTVSYEQELNKISTGLSASLGNTHAKTISIAGFTDLNGSETDLGEMLTEDLTVDLVNQNKGITIIDRSHHDQVDDDSKPDASKIDAVIAGTIIPLGPSYRIEVKITATDSGKLLVAKRFNMTRTDELDALMGIPTSEESISSNSNAAPFLGGAPIPKANLTLWLKADTGVKTDSQHRVKQWTDLSGAGHNVTQSSTECRPVFTPQGVHGKPVIQFDGSTWLCSPAVVTTGQDYSVFLVSSLGGISGPFYTGESGSSGWGLNRHYDANAYGLLYGGNADIHFGAVANADGEQLLSAIRGSGTTNYYAFGAFAGSSSATMASPAGTTFVGATHPPEWSFTGNIAEIIVYDRALSDEERQSVERYLAAKYDIKLNISSKNVSDPTLSARTR